MSSRARRKVKSDRSRPSTFFIVAILVALAIVVAAFVGYVSRTPGAKAKPKTTSSPAFTLDLLGRPA